MPATGTIIRFGTFQLDIEAGQLLRSGRVVKLKPQPFKLLALLANRPGQLVTRDEIRQLLWGADTFVDFEQGVNTAVRQIRDALGDEAERPLYLETVPRRGYRFISPVESATGEQRRPGTDLNLQKALWLNIAELRLAEMRRKERRRRAVVAAVVIAGMLLAALVGRQILFA